MFKNLVVILVVVFLPSVVVAQPVDTVEPIFRYADLGLGGQMVLGELFSINEAQYVVEEAGTYRVPMSYPGTSWIRVYTDKANRIGAMLFSYNVGYDFQRELASYNDDLGSSTIEVRQNGLKVYSWADSLTSFQLAQTVDGRGYSILSDLDLWKEAAVAGIHNTSGQNVVLGVKDVLATSEIWGVLDSGRQAVKDYFRAANPEFDESLFEPADAAVDQYFTVGALYSSVVRHMNSTSTTETLNALLPQLFGDEAIRTNVVLGENPPEESLESYANGLGDNPPSSERVNLIMHYAAVNHVADYMMGMDDSFRQAANAILASAPFEAELLTPIGEDHYQKMQENIQNYALVSLLWQMQPLDDNQLAISAEMFGSESGQWFVTAYIEAVLSAFVEAGEKAAAALAGS